MGFLISAGYVLVPIFAAWCTYANDPKSTRIAWGVLTIIGVSDAITHFTK